MDAMLRQAPAATRQVFIVSTTESSLQTANPKYLRLGLGVTPEIVRLVEIDWKCTESDDRVTFDHSTVNGVVNMTLTLPACAKFCISAPQLAGTSLATARLVRGSSISYDLTERPWTKHSKWFGQRFFLGRRITLHVRPNGPARFIIEQGRPNDTAWFDTP
jgi:hypothetical protein